MIMDHADFDDIPGTTVFTVAMSRRGYHLNQFCMSLMSRTTASDSSRRATYLDEWAMTDAQKRARAHPRLQRRRSPKVETSISRQDHRGDGQSFLQGISTMTGMTQEAYGR